MAKFNHKPHKRKATVMESDSKLADRMLDWCKSQMHDYWHCERRLVTKDGRTTIEMNFTFANGKDAMAFDFKWF